MRASRLPSARTANGPALREKAAPRAALARTSSPSTLGGAKRCAIVIHPRRRLLGDTTSSRDRSMFARPRHGERGSLDDHVGRRPRGVPRDRRRRGPRRAAVTMRDRPWLTPLLLVGAGVAAYADSFHGPFFFDDLESIPGNPTIRHLWPPWVPLLPPVHRTVAGRPLVNLSLAVNYALGGLHVEGYHALNLVLHLANGLLLWALVRRTLAQPRLRAEVGEAGPWLATAIALLWLVHPLATESVTYVIQRCELLMAFFLLLTLYGVARGWTVLAIVACALGMASKEVMVVTPLLALAYDRIFMFRRGWALHVGLAETWFVLAGLVA